LTLINYEGGKVPDIPSITIIGTATYRICEKQKKKKRKNMQP